MSTEVKNMTSIIENPTALSDTDLEDAAGGRGITGAVLAGMMLFSSMGTVATFAADKAAVSSTVDPAENTTEAAAEDADKETTEAATEAAAENADKETTEAATEAAAENNSSYIDKLNEKREKEAEEKAKQKKAEQEKQEKQKEEESKQRREANEAAAKERAKNNKEQAEKDAKSNAELAAKYAEDMQKQLDEKNQMLSKLSAEEKKKLEDENALIESYIQYCGKANTGTVISNIETLPEAEPELRNGEFVIKKVYLRDDSRTDNLHPIQNTNTAQLGQIIKVDEDLKNCNPSCVSLSQNQLELTIDPNSVRLKGGELPTIQVDPNGKGSVNNGMQILLNKINTGNIESSANIMCSMTTIDSVEQYNATMNVRQKFYGDAQLDVSAEYFQKHQLVMLELNQIYYTLSVNRRAGDPVFASNVTYEDVRKACTGTTEKSQRQLYWDACDKLQREIDILEEQIKNTPEAEQERINNKRQALLDKKDALLELKLQGCPEISIQDEPKGTPLAMVTDVHYGRRIVCFIETNDKSFDLKAALAAAGFKDKITGNISVEMNTKLASCTAHYYILGGSTDAASRTITGICPLSELLPVLNEDTKLTVGTAHQIGYTARYLDGNNIASVHVTNVHPVTEEHVKKATKLNIHNDHITKWNDWNKVTIYGKEIEGYNEKTKKYKVSEKEVEIASATFYKDGGVDGEHFYIPGNIDLNTVIIKFDAEGAKFKGTGTQYVYLKKLVGADKDANIIDSVDVCTSARLDGIWGFWCTWHVESSVQIQYPDGNRTRYVKQTVADDYQLDNDGYSAGFVD